MSVSTLLNSCSYFDFGFFFCELYLPGVRKQSPQIKHIRSNTLSVYMLIKNYVQTIFFLEIIKCVFLLQALNATITVHISIEFVWVFFQKMLFILEM